MAIARDNHTDGGLVNPGTSLTFAHTVSGSERILFVGVFGNTSGTDGLITGVTYNGVAMTKVGSAQVPVDNRIITLWYLVAPATGSNNVVISASASIAIDGQAASYTGVSQGGELDASTTNTTGGTASFTTSLTTVANNAWTFLVAKSDSGVTLSAGSGSSLLQQSHNMGTFDSNAALTPAGVKSMTVNFSPNGHGAAVMASFKPSQTAAPSLVSSTPTVYAPTITKKYTISPSLITSSPTVYAPTIGKGAVTASPALVSSSPTVYAPTTTEKYTITPSLVASTPTVYAPSVTQGQTAQPDIVMSTPTVYAPTVSPGPVTITLSIISSTPTVFSPTVLGVYTITLSFIARTPTVYAPTLIPGAATISPGLVSSAPTVYIPTLFGIVTIFPGIATSTPTVYTAALGVAQHIDVDIVQSTPVVYVPIVILAYTITPAKVTSSPTVYAPTITTLYVIVGVPFVSSTPTVYVPAGVSLYKRLPAGIFDITEDKPRLATGDPIVAQLETSDGGTTDSPRSASTTLMEDTVALMEDPDVYMGGRIVPESAKASQLLILDKPRLETHNVLAEKGAIGGISG